MRKIGSGRQNCQARERAGARAGPVTSGVSSQLRRSGPTDSYPRSIPPSQDELPYPTSHFLVCCDMSHQSGPSLFQTLFESALQDYEIQTGIPLPNHPLAQQLQNCQSVESVTAILQEQAQAFNKFRESDKIFKSLKGVVSALSGVSAITAFGQAFSTVCPRQLVGCSTFLTPIR